MRNETIKILFAAGLVAFSFGEMLEFIIILIIILLTVFLGFFQEYRADRTIKALNKLTAKEVAVLRDGKKRSMPADGLVTGDIVFLKRGDIVPADLRLIKVDGLQVGALTLVVRRAGLAALPVLPGRQGGLLHHAVQVIQGLFAAVGFDGCLYHLVGLVDRFQGQGFCENAG